MSVSMIISHHKIGVHIDRRFRTSGLLTQLSPEDLQTLVCLLTYADEHGICILSGRDAARTLDLSEKQGINRLKRLLQFRFQGTPLVTSKTRKRTRSGRFAKSRFCISPLPGVAIHRGNWKPEESNGSRSTSAGTETPLSQGKTVRFHTPQRRLGKLSSGSPTVTAQDKDVVVNKYIKTTTQQQAGKIAGETKQRELVEFLRNHGVTEITAEEIAGRYPIEQIENQIVMLPYRQARDPAAMLVKAIREDWDAPSAYTAILRTETRKREQEKADAAEEERQKTRERRVEKALSKLSPEQRQKIAERARREVEDSLKGAMGGRTPVSLVDAQMKKIISEEYLDVETG